MKKTEDDEPGGSYRLSMENSVNLPKIQIKGAVSKNGIRLNSLFLKYPSQIWSNFPQKKLLLDNLAYLFTAHLPLLKKSLVSLKYNTDYPASTSLMMHTLLKWLPLHSNIENIKIEELLKQIINTETDFKSYQSEKPIFFKKHNPKNVIIPFTFGKDSFLTYNLAKEIGLSPTLIYFDEKTEKFSKKHKLHLIEKFKKSTKKTVHFIENSLGSFRASDNSWYGWEMALSTWAIMSLPFAYSKKAKYILFSSEQSCNDFFYDKKGFKNFADLEQSNTSTIEISFLTEALSAQKVHTANFIESLYEIAILWILKNRYPSSLNFLMSCWAEDKKAKNERWCCNCSKCARIYLFLSAIGADPKASGFTKNLLSKNREHLFNIFSKKTLGTGYDSFETNKNEQLLAFYLCYLRKNKSPLIKKFTKSNSKKQVEKNFNKLSEYYLNLNKDTTTPPEFRTKIHNIFKKELKNIKNEISKLKKNQSRVSL